MCSSLDSKMSFVRHRDKRNVWVMKNMFATREKFQNLLFGLMAYQPL